MHAVLVAFDTRSAAYGFVSEIRRRADSLLWDVHVRGGPDGPVVVVPERVWELDGYVKTTALRFGGSIHDDDRASDRPR